jgi:hypothetical protein
MAGSPDAEASDVANPLEMVFDKCVDERQL